MDTDAWERAGLYSPTSDGADERLALIEYLTARGATIQQMVEAHALGRLPAVAGDLVLGATPATLSVSEVANRSRIPVERVQRILLSLGLPVMPDELVNDDWVELIAAFETGAAIMGEDALLAFTRVVGAAATNVAEAAVALFYSELGPGTEREGSDELARAAISETATLAFGTVPDVLNRTLFAQFQRANHRAALARGWSAPDDARAGADSGGAPGGAAVGEVVALGFVDLVDSTSWAHELTLRDHSLALSRFETAAWSSALLAGGRVIKMIGDEVFFAAPTADIACRIASDVIAAAAADPVLPSARGAVGYGLATPREGDYFGPVVNVVARLTKTAVPGGLVTTSDAARTLDPDHWTIDDVAPQPLKGIDEPVPSCTVHRRHSVPVEP
jgi:adenylate cyclase